MGILLYELIASLRLSLDILTKVESSAIKDEDLKVMNDLLIIHRDLFRIIEKIEQYSISRRKEGHL